MKTSLRNILYTIALLTALSSCSFFGEKNKVSDIIEKPDYSLRPVEYVPILPILAQGVTATQVYAGFDQLVYVVDSGQAILSFDQAGNQIGRFALPGVTFVIQNRSLDLLALGKLDTVIQGRAVKLPYIYKISQKITETNDPNTATFLNLNQARVVRRLLYPYFIRENTRLFDPDFASVRFNAIGITQNNGYYVTSSGDNDEQFTGRITSNNAILRFSPSDAYQGEALRFPKPHGFTTLVSPPQRINMEASLNFAFTSLEEGLPLKVRYYNVTEDPDAGISYIYTSWLRPDTSQAQGYIDELFKFERPVSINFVASGRRLFLVTDEARHKVYIFQENGFEGINPPAQSRSRKLVNVSFGGLGNGVLQFNRPQSATIIGRILYVADAGNKRLMRYRLTLDYD
jgi:hypothetical protein